MNEEVAVTDGAVLSYGDGELDLPRIPASEGSDGLGVSDLLSTTGKVALDVGFVNTASCESAITYIDGGEGILRYRGYPIEQLAEHSTYLEVVPADLRRTTDSGPVDGVLRLHNQAHDAA